MCIALERAVVVVVSVRARVPKVNVIAAVGEYFRSERNKRRGTVAGMAIT